MDETKLRSWWWHRQGLDGSLQGTTAAEVLERAGWARSVGGVGPYLTLFARAGLGRQAVDDAVARLEIHELPAARNCTYVVPAQDFALALRVGQETEAATFKTAAKVGVTNKEIDRLSEAILQAVDKVALEPQAIRDRVGKLARNLGEEGKRKGLTTTVPIALSRLQALGEIRRVPINGRLDQQRYSYRRWKPNPLAKVKGSAADDYVELARKFFRWVGPATVAEFRWFSGLGVRAAAAAIMPLGLVASEPECDRLLLSDDLDSFRKFKPPRSPQYALVSALDSISATRRDVRSLLESQDVDREMRVEKIVGTLGGLSDLPSHAIFDRGRVIGLWEYDFDAQKIVHFTFGIHNKKLDAIIAKTEAYVRDELGDARSFSLDSPASRNTRLDAIRAEQ